MTVLQRLTEFLERHEAKFHLSQHAPVFTSEEAAQVRGTSLASGAKALVCKLDDRFALLVMPADRRLDSKLARKALGIKGIRFATREEVVELTALTPGSIPPFGQLFTLPTYCDSLLAQQPQINFNAGDHAVSISMPYGEYIRVEQPTIASLSS